MAYEEKKSEKKKKKKKKKKKHYCTVGWSEVKRNSYFFSGTRRQLNLCV